MNLARRLVRELVNRRTRVRIFEATPGEERITDSPIFVIGLYRSGTTLLRFVLDSHSRIAIPPETSFVPKLADLVNDERHLAGFYGMGFDREHVLARIRGFLTYFFTNYARSQGKQRWGDKSPNHVDHLSSIAELFPSAVFLMITRDPLDQVHSFTKGGTVLPDVPGMYEATGEDPRILAARYWAERTDRMLEFASRAEHKCFVLSYESLVEQPEVLLKEVFRFLGEEWEDSVLRFHEFPHDFGLEDDAARLSTGFVRSGGRWRSWPQSAIAECLDIVDTTRQKAGYA